MDEEVADDFDDSDGAVAAATAVDGGEAPNIIAPTSVSRVKLDDHQDVENEAAEAEEVDDDDEATGGLADDDMEEEDGLSNSSRTSGRECRRRNKVKASQMPFSILCDKEIIS